MELRPPTGGRLDVDERVLQRYGREIARLRRDSEMTQVALARKLGISPAQMSNLERGGAQPRPRVRAQLAETLAPDGYLNRLWDDLTGSSHPTWLDELADLERQAMSIQEFQLALVPGVLQTEDYARAVIRLTSPWAQDAEVEARVHDRMKRAQQLSSSSPLMWVVLDGSVIGRQISTNGIMRAQLAHMAELGRSGRIVIQVVDGPHAGLSGPFEIIAGGAAPDVVYAESPYSGQVIDEPADVHHFRLLFGALQATARPPEESLRVIEERMKGLKNG